LGKLAQHYAASLKNLAKAVQMGPPLTFLSSSLLLMYEGDCCPYTSDTLPDVRLIDYDKTIWEKDVSETDKTGVVMGILNLSRIFKAIGKEALNAVKENDTFSLSAPSNKAPRRRKRTMSDPNRYIRDSKRGIKSATKGNNRCLANFANQSLGEKSDPKCFG